MRDKKFGFEKIKILLDPVVVTIVHHREKVYQQKTNHVEHSGSCAFLQ